MKRHVVLAGTALAAVFVATSAGGAGLETVYSLHELQRLSVTAAAFDKEGHRLVASFYVAAQDRGGTHWDAFVAEWDVKTGKRTRVAKATTPVLFGEGGKLAMALWERSRKRGFRAVPHGSMALWRFGETEPYKVLQRGPG